MTGKTMTKVEAEPQGVAAFDPELAKLYASMAGSNEGLENIGREDTALPFLKVLQGLSPEVTRGSDKFIREAQTGMFINSLTGELWDGEAGIEVIRVYFDKKFIEWKPRKSGGGLVRISATAEEGAAHKVKDIGNEDVDTTVDETHQVYCLVRGKYGLYPVLFSAARTKLTFVRKWNAVAMGLRFGEFAATDPTAAKLPPDATPKSFAVVYTIGTVGTVKNGNSYFSPVIKAKRLARPDELKAAMDFAEIVKQGAVKVEYKSSSEDADAVPGAGVEGAV
jgi:hypothetical protein